MQRRPAAGAYLALISLCGAVGVYINPQTSLIAMNVAVAVITMAVLKRRGSRLLLLVAYALTSFAALLLGRVHFVDQNLTDRGFIYAIGLVAAAVTSVIFVYLSERAELGNSEK